MPKQKLVRKPPKRRGMQGQIQSRGAHDPEHQEGKKAKRDKALRDSINGDNPPVLINKRSVL